MHALANQFADMAKLNLNIRTGTGSAHTDLSNGGLLIAVVCDRPREAHDDAPRMATTFYYKAPGEKYSKSVTLAQADELLRKFSYPDKIA